MEKSATQAEKMKLRAYLVQLGDGHQILRESTAQQIRAAFQVPWSDKLVRGHAGNPGRGDSWSGELRGVWDLDLVHYVADKLQVGEVRQHIGRGFQAQAYAEAIYEKLGL